MTDNTQPDALRLAALYDADAWPGGLSLNAWAAASAAELRRLHAENVRLQQELIRESHRTAEQKLRADQMTRQHADQAAMNREARAQLAALVEAQQPSPTPQADSQPARDERDDFEKVFPPPSGCIRVGTGYAPTGYSNWAAHTHCERWQGWQARAARATADSVTAPAGGVVVTDDMVLAALRAQYPAAYGQYLRHPANGPKTSLRTESEIDTARRMIVAALSAAPIPPTHAADSVLEDAADPLQGAANWLVEAHSGLETSTLAGKLSIGYIRAKRLHDAARKKGANHDHT